MGYIGACLYMCVYTDIEEPEGSLPETKMETRNGPYKNLLTLAPFYKRTSCMGFYVYLGDGRPRCWAPM